MEAYSGKQFVGIDLRGGPFNRAAGTDPHPDFLFPQMVSPEMGPEHVGTTLPRLPLHRLHQRHGLLADRHHAAVAMGEVIDGPAKRDRPLDHGAGPCARGQHPEMR
jgi:hypothetical protein